ncbi:MAG: DUF4358 domain-containing protein [Bacilli bacterium]
MKRTFKWLFTALCAFALVLSPLTTEAASITQVEKVLKSSTDLKNTVRVSLRTQKNADLFGIKAKDVRYGYYGFQQINVKASEYAIITAQKGREKVVRQAIEKHAQAKIEQWKTYLPDQYELVKNYKIVQKGSTFTYIVSTNADALEKKVKSLK